MAVQDTYQEMMDAGRAGAIVNTEPKTLISRSVEGGTIGFGVAVAQGAADKGIIAAAGSAATVILGITVRERSVRPETPNGFGVGESARVMTKGVIWVEADGAVAAGDDVTVTLATGGIGTAAVAAGVIAIPNARWDTSAADGELAQLRLS